MMDFLEKALPAIVLIGSLVTIYIASYVMNKKTPVPEECLQDLDEATCTACNISTCSNKH